MLGVSAMTIRRDLDELEKHKKLIRTHGGATHAQTIMTEVSYNQKLLKHVHKKNRNCRKSSVTC